jgi:hypothetical protein
MIICLKIFISYNYRFSNTWFLCSKMTKILFSKKMTRSQRSKRFASSFSHLYRQRNDALQMQMLRHAFVLFLKTKSIWKITCHSVFFFDFYLALKWTNKMIFIAIDAFSFFNQRCAYVIIMRFCANRAASFIFVWFFNVFITLTIKTLF